MVFSGSRTERFDKSYKEVYIDAPLNRRIAYRKKGRSPLLRYLFILLFISAVIYLLFYFRLGDRTIYERGVGFFKSEIEKSPSVTIVESNNDIHGAKQHRPGVEKSLEPKKDSKIDSREGDEIEEIIKKKLKGE